MDAKGEGKEKRALDVNFEDMIEEDLTRVPRLDDLCVQFLAAHIEQYPALDHIKSEYVTAAVELISTKKIPYATASKYIKNEAFWKKSTLTRWPGVPSEIAEHGMSWRRLYAEYHISEAFERFYPSKCGTNLHNLIREVEHAKPYVQTIKFSQLRATIDLSKVLGDFQNLQTLNLTYGNKDIGMGYEKNAFGMKLQDAMSLGRLIANSKALTRLILKENLLNDESIQVLGSGMAKNNTITYLDLSHNRIGDLGAQRLAKLLSRGSMLIDLNLTDNVIHKDGAIYFAEALSENDILGTLSLRQNCIGDEGGSALFISLADNDSLTELDLGANELKEEAGKNLRDMLTKNENLTSLDLSCNKIVTSKEIPTLLEALKENKSLTKLDLRKNLELKKDLEPINKFLRPRMVKLKQSSRKKYQAGWDLLDD